MNAKKLSNTGVLRNLYTRNHFLNLSIFTATIKRMPYEYRN
jgi:hypothetical protein